MDRSQNTGAYHDMFYGLLSGDAVPEVAERDKARRKQVSGFKRPKPPDGHQDTEWQTGSHSKERTIRGSSPGL